MFKRFHRQRIISLIVLLLGLGLLPPTASLASGHVPQGSIDLLSQRPSGLMLINGWAIDPDTVVQPTTVHFYIDGAFAGLVTTEFNSKQRDRSSGFPTSSGIHAFEWPIPTQFLNGAQHSVTAWAIDNTGDAPINIGTRTFQYSESLPEGLIESVSDNHVTGWTFDYDDPSGKIEVHFYIDGQFQAAISTNVPRPDVSQLITQRLQAVGDGRDVEPHGFRWPIPSQFLDGQPHTIQAFAINRPQNGQFSALPLSGQTQIAFTNAQRLPNGAPNHLPLGHVDTGTSAVISGWAYDPDTPTSNSVVAIVIDGQVVAHAETVYGRGDPGLPTGTHGFIQPIPAQYRDGRRHEFSVLALDTSGGPNALLPNSYRSFSVSQTGGGALIAITGAEEIVYDNSVAVDRSHCNNPDAIPDMPLRAFQDLSGNVQLVLAHWRNTRLVASSLDALSTASAQCATVIGSHRNPDPAMYDGHEWMAAPYIHTDGSIDAIMHNEYHGWEYASTPQTAQPCPSSDADPTNSLNACWYNSLSLARSTDGGQSYTHAPAPSHVIASLHTPYEPDGGVQGMFDFSNIIHHYPDDGYYYAFFKEVRQNAATGSSFERTCLVRSNNLADPRSWRGWDGSSFNATFAASGYSGAPNSTCVNIFGKLGFGVSSLSYNTYLGRYLVIGSMPAYKPTPKDPSVSGWINGIYYRTSSDLLNWSQPQLIVEMKDSIQMANWPEKMAHYDYPSLMDPSRPGVAPGSEQWRNFETSGQHAYIYQTRNLRYGSARTPYDRDLVRMPVTFTRPEATFTSVAGDFDGNGTSDVASIHAQPDTVNVNPAINIELSTGSGFASGTWAAATPTHMQNGLALQSSYTTVAGDFNGDGKDDLATLAPTGLGGWHDWAAIELSTGSGFSSATWPLGALTHMHNGGAQSTYLVAAGDFNGDGKDDLAIASPDALGGWKDWIAIELSTGSGFQSTVWPATTPSIMRSAVPGAYHLLAGDFNGDGKDDLVTVSPNAPGGWASWYVVELSTGSGFNAGLWATGTPQHMRNGGTTARYRTTVGDVNADGVDDLITVSPDGGGFWANQLIVDYAQPGSASFQSTWKPATMPQHMRNGNASADYTLLGGRFNVDGRADVLALSSTAWGGWREWLALELAQPDQSFTTNTWNATTPSAIAR